MDNFNSSNWTGRTPRTMNEAFGPEASSVVDDAREWGITVATCLSLVMAMLAAAVFLFVSVFFTSAYAATLPPLDPTPMLQSWYQANDKCEGDRTDPSVNVWCSRRNQIGEVLQSTGYLQSYTDVWTGPITVNRFCAIMYTAEGIPQAQQEAYLRHEFQSQVPVRAQFALWNSPGLPSILLTKLPHAFTTWSNMMRQEAAAHAGDNDPTLRLIGDQQ